MLFYFLLNGIQFYSTLKIDDAKETINAMINATPKGLELMDKMVLQRFKRENKDLYEKYLKEERHEIFNAGRKANTRQRNNDWSL